MSPEGCDGLLGSGEQAIGGCTSVFCLDGAVNCPPVCSRRGLVGSVWRGRPDASVVRGYRRAGSSPGELGFCRHSGRICLLVGTYRAALSLGRRDLAIESAEPLIDEEFDLLRVIVDVDDETRGSLNADKPWRTLRFAP